MKLVIDCNVLISAGITNGVCRTAIIKALEQYEVIITPAIFDEYEKVISRKKFHKYRRTLESMLNIIASASTIIADEDNHNITLPDSDDLIYLNAGLNAKATYLVTGNVKDFPDKRYKSLTIITAREFLKK